MDFFVVFSDTWCATVPESWIITNKQTVAWPNKQENATLACKKGAAPKPDWKYTKYKKLLGPYKDYDTARAVEIVAVDISTSDEKSFQQILNMSKKISKRRRKKPARFVESDLSSDESKNDEDDESNTGRSAEVSEEKVPPTFVYQVVEDSKEKIPPTFSFQVDEEVDENDNNIENDNDSFETQPLDYGTYFDDLPHPLFNTKKTNMTNKPVVCKIENFDKPLHLVKTNKIITTSNQSVKGSSGPVNTDKSRSTENPKMQSINSNADLPDYGPEQLSKVDDTDESAVASSGNLNSFYSLDKSHKKADNASNQAIAQSRLSQTNNTAEKQSVPCHNCCPACRVKLDSISRKLDILLMNTNTDNPRQSSAKSPSILPDFPIASKQNLEAFNELLAENDKARKEYTDLISLRRNANVKKNIRDVLGYILSDEFACGLSWSGQKKTVKVENMHFVKILQDTITSSNQRCSLNDCKQAIMSWFQHANDRVKLTAPRNSNKA